MNRSELPLEPSRQARLEVARHPVHATLKSPRSPHTVTSDDAFAISKASSINPSPNSFISS
jgi:hypothetical protein